MAPEEKRVPVTFKIGILTQALGIDLVFVGIEQASLWVALQGLHHPEQGIFRDQVIII